MIFLLKHLTFYDFYHLILKFRTIKTMQNKQITRFLGKQSIGLTFFLGLGFIANAQEEKNIQEVVITAKSNAPYKVELDKKVYNVDQDLTSKGGTLQDVLSNVPSVNVESDGSVSMRGNSNVKFLINGKPSSVLGISDDTSNALKSIPADQIERIEIITNPSSKFEAEGTAGILNIILKKNKKFGFNGSVNGSLGYFPASMLNTNLAWNYGKWNWFANGGGGISRPETETSSEIFYKNTGENLLMTNRRNPEMKNYNFSTGVGYQFSDKTSANASISLHQMEMEPNTLQDNHSNLTGTTFRESLGDELNKNLQIDANFEHKFNEKGHIINLSGSFQDAKNNSESNIADNRNATQTLYNYLNISDFAQKTWIAQLDYELPIGENSKLEAGARYDNRKNEIFNAYSGGLGGTLIPIADVTGNHLYGEKNAAFYAQFKSKIGNFGYQLGLRNEIININIDTQNAVLGQTKTEKNYSEFFPSVFLSYDITDNSQFSLNYSRRIRRPRSLETIPVMRMQNDPNRFMGNANLNPSFVNSFELAYNYTRQKWNISPTLYYQKTNDAVSFISEERTYLNPFTGLMADYILSTPYNIGKESRYGLDLNYSISPLSWLRFFGNLNLFRYQNETSHNGGTIKHEGNSSMARLTAAIRLDKTLNVQLQGHFRGGQKTYTTQSKDSYSLNFGISKSLWNNAGNIAFNVQDIFNTRKMRAYTDTDSFTRYNEMQMMPRQFTLSLSYRFGDRTDRNNKPKTPRRDQQGDDDMNVAY